MFPGFPVLVARPFSRHVFEPLLAVTMLPAAAVFWLVWRSLDQNRALETSAYENAASRRLI